MTNNFRLIMVSAGFEHGGNVTHRHLDGHSRLLVYPFESQLGNRDFSDFLATLERVQYRYPEFPEGLTSAELYEQIIDEEMKTYLRKRNGSKFKDVDLKINEEERVAEFKRILGEGPHCRKAVIEAFFRSTFAVWKNYHAKVNPDSIYVGYSPAIGLDAERLVRDFPNVKVMHIIRNPFSAYRDTKRRPFPQPISKYLISWNIYHSTVEMYARMYPNNVRIFRYEDMVADKRIFMNNVAEFIEVEFEKSMLYPSWNGAEIKESIAPWGTVLKSTAEYNQQVIDDLTDDEKMHVVNATTALARFFNYDQIPYLEKYYSAQ